MLLLAVPYFLTTIPWYQSMRKAIPPAQYWNVQCAAGSLQFGVLGTLSSRRNHPGRAFRGPVCDGRGGAGGTGASVGGVPEPL